MAASTSLMVDHVLNPDHDALKHSSVFEGADGNFFCVHCAADRYNSAPAFRRLALLDGIRSILAVHGVQPSLRMGGIDACLPMLLHGVDSTDTGVVQAATDIMLALRDELDDPVGVLASLVSSTVSLGLPRASGHLYLVGQLLTNASHDLVLATALGNACFGRSSYGLEAPQQAPLGVAAGGHGGGGGGMGMGMAGSSCRGGGMTERSVEREWLRGFGSFLASHASSASGHDHVKSDVLYVALELLDCCTTAGTTIAIAPPQDPPLPPPGDDPFVSIMLVVPRILAGRSSSDEPLQLHSIAYLATATAYCRLRTDMGVPGWSRDAHGVPEVLVALFDGAREFAPREMLADGGCGSSLPASSGGLCNTLKTLLMSSSYRVRSATARLITSLCSESRFSEDPSTAGERAAVCGADGCGGGGGGGGSGRDRKTGGLFFREVLIAAGATDFLFEAIKSEREGTTRFYLEAAEAFALSPVEFFHADNFSMKFAAPVLLGAFGDGGGGNGDGGNRIIDSENKAVVSSLSSRLLLHALVTLPSSGVVEELLGTAAMSTQLDAPDKTRAVGLAADVLGLIASGDLLLSKDRGSFLDAVGVLLDQLEEDLAAHSGSLRAPVETSSSSFGSASFWRERRDDDDGGLIFQCTRVYENLLHTAEGWVSSQGTETATGPPFRAGGRGFRGGDEEGDFLADLVFAAYARTLRCQCNLIARSETLAHDIAFLSCLGAAVDAASSVLLVRRRREEENSGGAGSENGRVGSSSSRLLLVRPSFVGVREVNHTSVDVPGETSTAASCLQTVLRVAVEADAVSWMLDLYARCGTEGSPGDGGDACGTTTRELLVEVLQSFLYAQGWVNGLCDHGVDHPSNLGGCSDGDDAVMRDGFSFFGGTVRLVIKSWTASGEGVPCPLDQYTLSLLGTNADNGDLCKLAVLLVSLSPSFLGMLHPHVECRLDSAVTLLRYVKTLPEAVFCLNLLSHIVLTGDRQTGGGGGGWRHLSGLSEAVKDLLARFPVGDVALSSIPLSAATLSFSLRAGCGAFFAGWLVASPLPRIKQALAEFGAFRGGEEPASDDALDAAANDEQQSVADSAQGFGREALTGVLNTALSRWGAEIDYSLQHHAQSDAVVHRLASVLLMSPDLFFSLAFDADSQINETGDGEQGERQEKLAVALGTIIPETLEILSAALSPVVSRRGDRGNDGYRASKLACVSQVSQLASALLRARCEHGCYASACAGMHGGTVSPSRLEPLEFSLARACGGLLQGVLHPRRGQGQGPDGGGDDVHRALLSVLNLLNALLVLAGGDSDSDPSQQATQGLTFALRESHAALSAVMAPPPSAAAIERLTSWLDPAPDTLAALLQACVLWNVIESAGKEHGDDPSRSRLFPPFQVLWEVLSLGGSGPCAIVGKGGGISSSSSSSINTGLLSKPQASPSTPRRGVRRCLLQVLAMRCVENAAQTRFFSHQEVLALQLTLQGMACVSSAAVASAAHGALRALWEAYAGLIESADLVGQSWNPFMVECSLQNALRSLSGDPDSVAALLRAGKDPGELCVDPPVVVSTIGRLLRWSEGKACSRLSHSKASDGSGSSLEVLSGTAAVYIHQCASLLATNLRAALSDGVDQKDDQLQTRRRTGCSDGGGGSGSTEGREEGMRSDSTFHLSDALAQMVQVLMYMQPLPQDGSAVGEGARWELVDALLSLLPPLRRFREVTPWLEQVSMPLSSGAHHDCAFSSNACNSYTGVFFVRYDNWRALCSSLEPVSLTVLAGETETLVERLSGRPGGAARTEVGKDRQVPEGA